LEDSLGYVARPCLIEKKEVENGKKKSRGSLVAWYGPHPHNHKELFPSSLVAKLRCEVRSLTPLQVLFAYKLQREDG
jgi:hypothetical protein